MPAITLGYSQIEEQIRVVRRRRNGFILQHALYLGGGVVVFAIALLVVLAVRTERWAFTLGFWASLGAIGLSLAAAAQIVWRRWITERGTARWIDRVAQLDDRLSTLVAQPRSVSPPPGGGELKRGEQRLLPALISQLYALRYRWEPATLVPRRVPRSLYFFLAAIVALIATSFVERPPATPQRFPQSKIIPAQGNGPDGGTGLRMAGVDGDTGAAIGGAHAMPGTSDDADPKTVHGHGAKGAAGKPSSGSMRTGKDASRRGLPDNSTDRDNAQDGTTQALPERVQEMIRQALHQPPVSDKPATRGGDDARQQAKRDSTGSSPDGRSRREDDHSAQMAQAGRDAEQGSQASATPHQQPDGNSGGRGTNGAGGGGQGTSGIYGKDTTAVGLDSAANKTFQLKLVLRGQSPSTSMEPQKPGHGDIGGLGFPGEREPNDAPLNPHQRADEPLVRSDIPAEHEAMIKRIFSRTE